MPRLSVVFIKTSLVYLVTGFTIGAIILVQKGSSAIPLAWRLLPAHIEILFFGWTLQLIVGTAYWILPRFGKKPIRGNENVVWAAYWLLNSGILIAVFSPLLPSPSLFLFLGRLAEGIGLLAFVANVWPRVKPFG